ncbi:MAG: copper oxidase [Chloroflexi bacterium]|nr:MAG: copper oxidase [Chloroflexota bacterium]
MRLLPLLVVPALLGTVAFGGARISSSKPVAAAGELPLVPPIFHLNDGPTWFDTGVDVSGTHSLAVATPGTQVKFIVGPPDTLSDHDPDSVIWPTGAEGMPFHNDGGFIGEKSVTLTTPGLYAFQCTIHPYMLGAVLVVDPAATSNGTLIPDFGKMLSVRGVDKPLPSASDYIYRLVRTFFIISNAENWKHYYPDKTGSWMPRYAPAPIIVHDANGVPTLIPNLEAFFHQYFHEPIAIPAITDAMHPKVPGVGEVMQSTQMEELNEKAYPGTVTFIDANTWQVARKFGLPTINNGGGLDNPHNQWASRDENTIYSDEWFSNKTTAFDRYSGQMLRQTVVGLSPAHVMTRSGTDELIVGINGENKLTEVAPGDNGVTKDFSANLPGEGIAHPHAHWLSGDGNTAVAPNANFDSASLFNLNAPDPDLSITKRAFVGSIPIATGMSSTADRAYSAGLMSNNIVCISTAGPACHDGGRLVDTKNISLTKGYDYVTGSQGGGGTGLPVAFPPFSSDAGPAAPGLLPIQNAVSPDNKVMVVANAASGNMDVIDIAKDEVIKVLPCDPGCHGVNWGAKKGGGYYAYVTSKFANVTSVVDPDPSGTGDISQVAVVGKFLTDIGPSTKSDVTPKKFNGVHGEYTLDGMGGQGVIPLPIVYNGWVQKLPDGLKAELTCRQRDPMNPRACG